MLFQTLRSQPEIGYQLEQKTIKTPFNTSNPIHFYGLSSKLAKITRKKEH